MFTVNSYTVLISNKFIYSYSPTEECNGRNLGDSNSCFSLQCLGNPSSFLIPYLSEWEQSPVLGNGRLFGWSDLSHNIGDNQTKHKILGQVSWHVKIAIIRDSTHQLFDPFSNGIFDDTTKLMVKNYLSSAEFKLDALSLLPLDVFYIMFGYTGRTVLLRFPRLLRFYHFDMFFDRLDAILPYPVFVR